MNMTQGTVLCVCTQSSNTENRPLCLGVVYAVQDGPTHVSVRPVGAPMEAWINAGSGSIWTQAVKSVVIKWDGGY